jgi:UDP-N-acetylglucosamine 2-epimerase (non-hydrolysing)
VASKIICVAGARPNFMKVAPIIRALAARSGLLPRLVHTGQHYDAALSQVFFHDLGLPRPDVELEVGSATHAVQTAEVMRRFEPVLQAEQPAVVLVVGDVNSTLACALVASKFLLAEELRTCSGPRRRPLVAHVEAGLRSFDDDMPEEVNRKLTDALSDLLFVSEPAGMANLRREGVSEDRIRFVGNVMIDSLLAVQERARQTTVLADLGLRAGGYGVVTLHRPSNVDDPRALAGMLGLLEELAAQVPLVFPMHPRTRARLTAAGVRVDPERVKVVDPVGYVQFIGLLGSARVVLTDSGGIQEETTVLGIPCVTLRDNTERPVTLDEGTNVLGGTSPETIRPAFEKAMSASPQSRRPRLWDGRASERIADALSGVLMST